ncbi:MAG TPA: YceI family protein [Anaerolineae bacterium]|nr:YceI family protein [Anaerolineae bacterium]
MPWKVDPANSEVRFLVKHFRLTTVRGRFRTFEGTLDMNEENPQASLVEGTVDTATISTGIRPRDADLRRRNRFNVRDFPKMSFKSTRIGPFEGNRFKVYGNLTIKGITKPVEIDVVDKGELSPVKGEPARRRHAFEARTQVNRKDFDIKWFPLAEIGSIPVAENIDIVCNMQFIKE